MGRGVDKLARVVSATLGPKGGNAIIDRGIGIPLVSRDGVSVANEIELEDRFENLGVQLVREVSKKTSETVGDGTTTAMVLAARMIGEGLGVLRRKVSPIDLVRGMERACAEVIRVLKQSAIPIETGDILVAVATIATHDEVLGRLSGEAVQRVGSEGIVTVQPGLTAESSLEILEGMSFDRGYISRHMVTEVDRMEAVLEEPYILLTDQQISEQAQVASILAAVADTGRPLLIIAEEVGGGAVATLLAQRAGGGPLIVAVNPPEFGMWRKAMLEDIAIMTGGKVIAKDLGGKLNEVRLADLGEARQAMVTFDNTVIVGGRGKPDLIAGRRTQLRRELEVTDQALEKEKLKERLAKISSGTAIVRVGGATELEQKHREQVAWNAVNATRAALEEGVAPGGGTSLIQAAPELNKLLESLSGSMRAGAALVQHALSEPLRCIAENAGLEAQDIVDRVAESPKGIGFNANKEAFVDMMADGVIDPVRVTCMALRNAVSVAAMVLTAQSVIVEKPQTFDSTMEPARGGGAELLPYNDYEVTRR